MARSIYDLGTNEEGCDATVTYIAFRLFAGVHLSRLKPRALKQTVRDLDKVLNLKSEFLGGTITDREFLDWATKVMTMEDTHGTIKDAFMSGLLCACINK